MQIYEELVARGLIAQVTDEKEIRELIDKLSDKPYEGGKRTVIIHDADKLNDTAQNAFLKTLEE